MKHNLKLIYGIATNDIGLMSNTRSYRAWKNILKRCYSKHSKKSYNTCEVSPEWLLFSNFNTWFNNNSNNNLDIDKDILVKGNKIYGPKTCRFVPRSINNIISKQNNNVTYIKQSGKYRCTISINSKTKHIGMFNTETEAINAAKIAKKQYIIDTATIEYKKGNIDQEIYTSLINW